MVISSKVIVKSWDAAAGVDRGECKKRHNGDYGTRKRGNCGALANTHNLIHHFRNSSSFVVSYSTGLAPRTMDESANRRPPSLNIGGLSTLENATQSDISRAH